MTARAVALLGDLWGELTGVVADPALAAVELVGAPDPVLPSVFRIGTLAASSVATATLAVARFGAERTGGPDAGSPPVRVDVRAAVASFRSERYLRLDGRAGEVWERLSGDYRTGDGWIRLHCNFPHHAEAARRALGAEPERAALGRAFSATVSPWTSSRPSSTPAAPRARCAWPRSGPSTSSPPRSPPARWCG